MAEYYKEDLAFIHDTGHGEFALRSAPGILETLRKAGIREGLVVDLGCGSGLWAEQLAEARYQVLGIDISESMIRIARTRAPDAEFRVGSLFDADIPPCAAVTSLGECLNYLFDPAGGSKRLGQLFRRVHDALRPGGLFIFDVLKPGQVARGMTTRSFSEGEDWAVLVEKHEDPRRATLTRRIISFREVGGSYRRDEEVHRQQLYKSTDVAGELRRAGFRARTTHGYGQYELSKAHAAFIARKPAEGERRDRAGRLTSG
jgi:SAM-dependent methyltransferase